MSEKNRLPVLTERGNPKSRDIDLMDSLSIVRIFNEEDRLPALAVEKELPRIAKAVDLIASAFLKGGRLAYFGAGTSGRLGVLDASECVPTFGVSPKMVQGFIAGGERALRKSVEGAEDDRFLAKRDLEKFCPTSEDVIVGLSANGGAAYVLEVLRLAREKGCTTIAVACQGQAKSKDLADIFICPEVGAEVITGSSRLKAGTAQKMVCNMLTSGAMIKIGKVYQNYMIDVRVMNKKLMERAVRFICEITGADEETARTALLKTNSSPAKYNVKTACVMILEKCSKRQAEKLLSQAGGSLRRFIFSKAAR